MRRNRLRELLTEDRPLLGAFLAFPTPRLVELAGHIGFDWVLIDAEHDALSLDDAYTLVLAADHVGIASVVRAPVNEPSVLMGFAETGASSVIAPHVDSAEAAERLVRSVSYPPRGGRGVSASSRAANFGLTQTPAEYFAAAEEHTIPAALLEDVSAYDELDDILAVPGLDVLCLGAGDLSGSMGMPGQAGHPDVVAKVEDAARRIRSAGKIISAGAGDAAGTRRAVEMGARLVQVPLNSFLVRGAKQFLEEVRAA